MGNQGQSQRARLVSDSSGPARWQVREIRLVDRRPDISPTQLPRCETPPCRRIWLDLWLGPALPALPSCYLPFSWRLVGLRHGRLGRHRLPQSVRGLQAETGLAGERRGLFDAPNRRTRSKTRTARWRRSSRSASQPKATGRNSSSAVRRQDDAADPEESRRQNIL